MQISKWYKVPVIALGCLALASCTAATRTTRVAQGPAGMHELTALYQKAAAPHRRAVRKPVRDQQAWAMHRMAEKSRQFLAETDNWDSEAKLTSIDEADRDGVKQSVASFRESLRQLEAAATQADTTAVRTSYARTMAAYEKVVTVADIGR